MDVTIRRAGVEHEPIDEGDSYSVGVDDGTSSGFSVLFMRSSDIDLEAEPGVDPYCITMSNGRSYYGGISGAAIERGLLEIDLTDEAASVLGVESTHWNFLLEITDNEFEALRSGLERVFQPSVHLLRRDSL